MQGKQEDVDTALKYTSAKETGEIMKWSSDKVTLPVTISSVVFGGKAIPTTIKNLPTTVKNVIIEDDVCSVCYKNAPSNEFVPYCKDCGPEIGRLYTEEEFLAMGFDLQK
jgi:hypothetical protein